ncbi:PhzF family phenazine biosynthesis protein [Romboutsia lituseburensis]|uniref:Phenazine biosynthesis protein PhzF family n=1 Tax=Romboutsia lituseburensis DSM 797 TaxID=1121325 RepID=A0A1G9IAB4_9FIRM|nr:PhzF family phenazine biosynthesis protein [Romboutsia lituseburensis]CEH33984.1 Phenazine biosynthesis protein PhzF [Romboutsia lituseburensis]SDL22052.1 phenazine biosynthesis protein PhzF family [Romboutsia lituseburensis DSM 797]
MSLKKYIVNAFTKEGTGGNGAGVVLNCENLSVEDMQNIAKEINLSETAFVQQSDKANFKVRFFTPTEEVDLCGHATIATFTLLRNLEIIEKGVLTQETKAGILKVYIDKKDVFMEQEKAKFYEVIQDEEILKSLNINKDDLDDTMPIQIVSTGLRDILIPVKNIEVLNKISLCKDLVTNISKKYDVVGYHVFCISENDTYVAHCRNFAPLYGIDEECATGTSNGALCSYLYKMKKLEGRDLNKLVFIQGEAMNKACEIVCKLNVELDEIVECLVGGEGAIIRGY